MTLTQLTSNHFQRINYRAGETATQIGLIATQAVSYCPISRMPADKVHSFYQRMLPSMPINERPCTFSGKRSPVAVTTTPVNFSPGTHPSASVTVPVT
ncbi:hypothetical protein FHK02_5038 [Spirosoma sp. LMG 31448]|uniref:Uncharacterized protein n=1 Tax=Spirosoma utsteinense TaxID=2585773 RepID=A0ABR6WD03_9BACT|nr:hypothetical protein [Spirosoma utsteinense]MBC3794450.1 hypothetical protein [Spirosoma utsteinense]